MYSKKNTYKFFLTTLDEYVSIVSEAITRQQKEKWKTTETVGLGHQHSHSHGAYYLRHLHLKLSSAHRPGLHCYVCLRPNLTLYCRDKMKPLLPCDRKPRDLLLGFLLVLACRGLACPCQNLREQIFALLLVVASVSLLLTAGLCLQVLTKPRMNLLQAQIAR